MRLRAPVESNPPAMAYTPKEVTQRLTISGQTLRVWSTKFGDLLSPAAQRAMSGGGQALQRRYTDEDIATFERIKTLLGQGLTFEQTHRAMLNADEDVADQDTPALEVEAAPEQPGALVLFQQLQAELRQIQRDLRVATGERDAAQAELRATVAGKDETIAALQAHIEDLRAQLDRVRPAPAPDTRSLWRRLFG